MNDRAKIASKQLAALIVADAIFCINEPGIRSHTELTDEAIALADMLLSKLDATAPIPSSPIATDSPSDKPRLLGELPIPKWQCLSFARPERYQPCQVVVWDSESGQIKSVDRLYWDGGMWEDGCGDCALGDVPDLQIYWCPSHFLPNSDDAIRISFVEFIESR